MIDHRRSKLDNGEETLIVHSLCVQLKLELTPPSENAVLKCIQTSRFL